jgi:hypothetical protein
LKVRRCDDGAIELDMDLVKLICNINDLNFDKVLRNPGPVVSSGISRHITIDLRKDPQPAP